MSIESVMPSNHLILCLPLLFPSIFPNIRSFPMNQLIASGEQRIGASASASVLPIQGWFPLGVIGLISLIRLITRAIFLTQKWGIFLFISPEMISWLTAAPPVSFRAGAQGRLVPWIHPEPRCSFLVRGKNLWNYGTEEVGQLWPVGWSSCIEGETMKMHSAYFPHSSFLDEDTTLLNWSLFEIRVLMYKNLTMWD